MLPVPSEWKIIVMEARADAPGKGQVIIDRTPTKIYTANDGKDVVFALPQHCVVLPLALMRDVLREVDAMQTVARLHPQPLGQQL